MGSLIAYAIFAGHSFVDAASATSPADILFSLPIACIPGQSCWVANHVDVDPDSSAKDFACGHRTYDGHNGTDFALRDLGVMRQGVDVLAAADGIVAGVRDGMDDTDFRDLKPDLIKGRECGNGVKLEHTNGWTSQYCHLRKGSVVVRKGQRLAVGERLGKVGLSGKTIFPHLHFQVEHQSRVIDPFIGRARQEVCGDISGQLWRDSIQTQLRYQPVVIYNAGVSFRVPNIDAIRDGRGGNELTPINPAEIYLWADLLGVEAGDEVAYSLRDVDGRPLFEKRLRLTERKARQFLYVGKTLSQGTRSNVNFVGTIRVVRRDSDAVVSDTVAVESKRR